MRFGLMEALMVLPFLAGLIWSIYELRKKPPATNWDGQKRELEELRLRLAELQTSKPIRE